MTTFRAQPHMPVDGRQDVVARLERENAQLRQAVDSHATVDQAIGVLLAVHRLEPAAAFDVLREVSQHSNIKLHTVAETVIEWALREVPLPSPVDQELQAAIERHPQAATSQEQPGLRSQGRHSVGDAASIGRRKRPVPNPPKQVARAPANQRPSAKRNSTAAYRAPNPGRDCPQDPARGPPGRRRQARRRSWPGNCPRPGRSRACVTPLAEPVPHGMPSTSPSGNVTNRAIVNVGTGRPTSIRQVADRVRHHCPPPKSSILPGCRGTRSGRAPTSPACASCRTGRPGWTSRRRAPPPSVGNTPLKRSRRGCTPRPARPRETPSAYGDAASAPSFPGHDHTAVSHSPAPHCDGRGGRTQHSPPGPPPVASVIFSLPPSASAAPTSTTGPKPTGPPRRALARPTATLPDCPLAAPSTSAAARTLPLWCRKWQKPSKWKTA